MWSCCRTLAAEPLGWTIVLCSFLADALSLGARALFVVVLIFWQKEFNWTTSELSGIMSLAHVMQGFVIFFVVVILHRVRHFFCCGDPTPGVSLSCRGLVSLFSPFSLSSFLLLLSLFLSSSLSPN